MGSRTELWSIYCWLYNKYYALVSHGQRIVFSVSRARALSVSYSSTCLAYPVSTAKFRNVGWTLSSRHVTHIDYVYCIRSILRMSHHFAVKAVCKRNSVWRQRDKWVALPKDNSISSDLHAPTDTCKCALLLNYPYAVVRPFDLIENFFSATLSAAFFKQFNYSAPHTI